MITYKYYKFPNKNLVPKPGEWPENVFFYEVGTIFNNDGIYGPGGVVIKEPTLKSGWHVNVCYLKEVDLSFIEQYEINVTTPNYIWGSQQ